jgi:hypothetical protein
MSRIEELKIEVLGKCECKYGGGCALCTYGDEFEEALKTYRTELLTAAVDNAKLKFHDGHNKTDSLLGYFQSGADNITVDKQSILDTEI